MEEEKKTKLTVKMTGEPTLEDFVNVLSGLDEALKATARVLGLPEEAANLRVTKLGFICDGCGKDRPQEHLDWIHQDGLDFCPDCQEDK